jgi:hypothetical protein
VWPDAKDREPETGGEDDETTKVNIIIKPKHNTTQQILPDLHRKEHPSLQEYNLL